MNDKNLNQIIKGKNNALSSVNVCMVYETYDFVNAHFHKQLMEILKNLESNHSKALNGELVLLCSMQLLHMYTMLVYCLTFLL